MPPMPCAPGIDIALARYTSDGSLDPSFGTAGRATTTNQGAASFGFAATLDHQGRAGESEAVLGSPTADRNQLTAQQEQARLHRFTEIDPVLVAIIARPATAQH